MAESVQISIVPDEIVTSTPQITVTCPKSTSVDAANRCIGIRGVDTTAKATSTKGEFRLSPDTALAPGTHHLVVEELGSPTGGTSELVVPFTVIDTPAKVPSTVRIESATRISLGADGVVSHAMTKRPEGTFIDIFKTSHRETDEPRQLAFNNKGKAVDADELLMKHAQGLQKKFGKKQPALAAALKNAKASDRIAVDVWLDLDEPDMTDEDRPTNANELERAGARAIEMREVMVKKTAEFARSLGDAKVLAQDQLAPLITIEATAAMLKKLESEDRVAALYLHELEMIDDLGPSQAIARSNQVHNAGETGTGIRVAVWESGPSDTSDLVIAGRYTNNPSTSTHSQHVHAIIRNNEAGSPDGHAPGCSLYSANSGSRAALTWAVADRDCTVINQSFHRSSEPHNGGLSSDDLYGDYIALRWPYPLIVHAAGNYWQGDNDNVQPPSSEYVNHKGYNTISVANHNDSATALSGSSVFRNPTSSHGDRELPEIAANGTYVTADGMEKSGTSMSSPAVAGVAALLQGTNTVLKHWPEACRAILFAGATKNITGQTWWKDVVDNVDAGDGAGAVNAQQSRRIALQQRWRNAPASQHGWHSGRLRTADFNSSRLSTFDYKVKVPSGWFGPRNVKVALAWTSSVFRIFGFYASSLTVDLDLKIYDSSGSQVAYSGSWDNSYEIAEFRGKPGEEYTIRIRRWSGTHDTWYGIGWTVTGGITIGQLEAFGVPLTIDL